MMSATGFSMENHQPESDMEGQGLISKVAGVHPSNANNLADYFEVGDNQETRGGVLECWARATTTLVGSG